MRLGGQVFIDTRDPDAVIREHKRLGYRSAYVPYDFEPGQAIVKEYEQAFRESDVRLAEVSCFCNPVDKRPGVGAKNFDHIVSRLTLAEEIGARSCTCGMGTADPERDWGPHPGNYSEEYIDELAEVMRRVIDTVKPVRTRITFETTPFAFLDSGEACLDFAARVNRDAVAIHYDPCNCIGGNVRRLMDTKGMLEHDFALFGSRLVNVHVKDLDMDKEADSVIMSEVMPGTGWFDHRALLTLSKDLDVDLMLEHLHSAEEYDVARRYMLGLAEELGLKL